MCSPRRKPTTLHAPNTSNQQKRHDRTSEDGRRKKDTHRGGGELYKDGRPNKEFHWDAYPFTYPNQWYRCRGWLLAVNCTQQTNDSSLFCFNRIMGLIQCIYLHLAPKYVRYTRYTLHVISKSFLENTSFVTCVSPNWKSWICLAPAGSSDDKLAEDVLEGVWRQSQNSNPGWKTP